MIRKCLAALAFAVAGACTYGSAVDLAPLSERIPKQAVSTGDFCGVNGDTPPFTVVSSSDCVPVTWDQSTRTYTVVLDPDDPDDILQVSPVSLGGGLYLAQSVVDPGEPEAPDHFQLFLVISHGDAFALLPVLEDQDLADLAGGHAAITFAEDRAGRLFFAAGDRPDIRAFLREAAVRSLRLMTEKGDALSIGVRDTAGSSDHPASDMQTRDIDAVQKIARDLAPA